MFWKQRFRAVSQGTFLFLLKFPVLSTMVMMLIMMMIMMIHAY